jgi:hypothetical protein
MASNIECYCLVVFGPNADILIRQKTGEEIAVSMDEHVQKARRGVRCVRRIEPVYRGQQS